MDWFNSIHGKIFGMMIGGAVFFTLHETVGVPSIKPQLKLKESAPDWAPALTLAMAVAILATVIVHFKFGAKVAGPLVATLIYAAIFVRLWFYG